VWGEVNVFGLHFFIFLGYGTFNIWYMYFGYIFFMVF